MLPEIANAEWMDVGFVVDAYLWLQNTYLYSHLVILLDGLDLFLQDVLFDFVLLVGNPQFSCLQLAIKDSLALAEEDHCCLVWASIVLKRSTEEVIESVGSVLLQVDVWTSIAFYFVGQFLELQFVLFLHIWGKNSLLDYFHSHVQDWRIAQILV